MIGVVDALFHGIAQLETIGALILLFPHGAGGARCRFVPLIGPMIAVLPLERQVYILFGELLLDQLPVFYQVLQLFEQALAFVRQQLPLVILLVEFASHVQFCIHDHFFVVELARGYAQLSGRAVTDASNRVHGGLWVLQDRHSLL